MTDNEGVYFGKGTTPEKVVEAIERAAKSQPRDNRARPTTEQRDRFFQRMAEDLKRAGGQP